jgi:hypothetical protein
MITLMLPDVPRVAEPDRNATIPVLPFVVIPEVSESELDTPALPASAERILKAPLDVLRP